MLFNIRFDPFLQKFFITFVNKRIYILKDMAKVKGAVSVNIEKCKGCNLCVVACPTSTLSLQPNEVNNRGYHYAFMADPDKCIGCCSCAWVCPDACIEVYRVKID